MEKDYRIIPISFVVENRPAYCTYVRQMNCSMLITKKHKDEIFDVINILPVQRMFPHFHTLMSFNSQIENDLLEGSEIDLDNI